MYQEKAYPPATRYSRRRQENDDLHGLPYQLKTINYLILNKKPYYDY